MQFRRVLYLSMGSILGFAPHPAFADSEAGDPYLKVEVTGSRIARIDGETALPLQTITRDEIQRAGWTTAAELVGHLSASMNGWNDQQSVSADDVAGKAFANLRGLGSASTLVLLNGRRLANYAYSSVSVDLNSIPMAAIDRVEVLKDGASSIYGSDAIAGVINFITRNDYRGFDAAINGQVTEQGADSHREVTLSAGIGDLARDRYNAFLTFDWQKDSGLPMRDRVFSNTALRPDLGVDALSSAAFPANIVGPSGFLNPALASGCTPPISLPTKHGHAGICGYDYATVADAIPPTERVNVLGRTTLALGADTQLYAELLYTWNSLIGRIASSPVNAVNPTFYPAAGPYYPTQFAADNGLSGDLELSYRTVGLGPRQQQFQTNAERTLLGVQGTWRGWDYDTAYLYSANTAHSIYLGGYVSSSALANALATGLINPFGPSSAQGEAQLASTQIFGQVRRATSTVNQVDGHASRDLFDLPGGALSIAVGVEARRETLNDDPSGVLASGDVAGGVNPIQSASVGRNVESGYAEAIVPVTKAVETQLSLRYDHYSNSGSTTNAKLAVRWQPAKTLLVRGSLGTGFRAPTLSEAYTPLSEIVTGSDSYVDYTRCPVTGSDADCAGLGFNQINGGNPSLKPEKSTQYNLGIVWEPARGNSITVDYWNISKRDEINELSPDLVFESSQTFAALAAETIVRGPSDPANPSLPGPIVAFASYPLNVGNVNTAGVDIDAIARSPVLAVGRFTLRFDGTLVTRFDQTLKGLPAHSALGAYGVDGPIPRWRHYGALTWEQGPWSATTAQSFQTGYTDESPVNDASRRVGSYSIWDVQAVYTGFRSVTLVTGIHNLFNRNPPASDQTDYEQVGYDPRYGDPRGRAYYVTMRYAFR
ncbi:MAG: TonB-dependent receptor [Steroidobacterales bacterium]